MHLTKRLVLASRSPRRLSLLRQIGLDPQVVPCDIPEIFDPARSLADNAKELALRKAREVGKAIDDAIILGADTIVAVDGTLLSKPADASDAARMLQLLSGRSHRVCTGFALLDRPSGRWTSDAVTTTVTFRTIPREEIEEYVAGGSPMDKAGAYGIQDDYGAVFVTEVEGCFYNVVGLPLSRFYTALMDFQNTTNR